MGVLYIISHIKITDRKKSRAGKVIISEKRITRYKEEKMKKPDLQEVIEVLETHSMGDDTPYINEALRLLYLLGDMRRETRQQERRVIMLKLLDE